jgi:vancomycin resistance protein YoaR
MTSFIVQQKYIKQYQYNNISPNKMKKNKIIFLIITFLIIASIGAMVYFDYQKYSDKILPNIFINGENYSNLTAREAENKLEEKIKSFQEKGISLSYEKSSYNASFEDLGININAQKTISSAFLFGHRNSIVESLKDKVNAYKNNISIPLSCEIDEKVFSAYIEKNLSEIENPPKDFGYKYEKDKFIPVPAESGMIINMNKLKNDISQKIVGFENKPIWIELVKKDPEAIIDKNGDALLEAENLLKKIIILKYNSSQWKVQKEDLALWIDFGAINSLDIKSEKNLSVKIGREKTRDYLLSLVPQINREPVNAQLEFKKGKIGMFSLSQEGIILDIEKSIDEINKIIFTEENYKDNSEAEIEVQMTAEKVQPKITTESIDNMGITSLLATGESNFYGSPNNRKHNIAVGAARFQGILVGPGDEFSFNEALGDVGPREGYLPELVIKKGQTIPEYGGGLCQVSTTAFRAAVQAGMEITERKNHAYPVKYYDPQGTDATIYPPHPDLSFKNNTPAYILIQTRIEGTKLFFDFYGSDDGRKVKLIGPYIYDKQPDGSMKSVWTQQVYDKSEELLFEKKFYSVYKSPALYPHKNPLE